jgi:hypothetical protein
MFLDTDKLRENTVNTAAVDNFYIAAAGWVDAARYQALPPTNCRHRPSK